MNILPQASARRASTFRASGLGLGLGLSLGAALLLAACGGGQGEQPQSKEAEASMDVGASSEGLRPAVSLAQLARGGAAPGPASLRDRSSLAQGARLNQDSLSAAEQQAQATNQAFGPGQETPKDPEQTLADLAPGQIAPKSAYLSGDVARKAAAVRIPAYRFYNGSTGAHFYTINETERATVAATLSPPFSYEGPAFSVASDHSAGLSSVHRFYNTRTGVHFYTISEAERANVANNMPHFAYEGVAYFASSVAGAGLTPLHRFYVHSRGFHFYTASATEKANIEATLSATYTYEGIGYYVLDTGWNARARLPHTGITTSQCYQAGSNALVACAGSGATALNPQQDGHRAGIAPMSYSAVPSIFGPYPITNCVRDVVTGLVWEGKTAAGERAGNLTYTNLGNNAATDASGYVAAVNAAELCGYTDWRLPTLQELISITDLGTPSSAPKLNPTWFPNAAELAGYWSSEVGSTDSTFAWGFEFNLGSFDSFHPRNEFDAVRLVRGEAQVFPRFSFSTIAYTGDATNNVVNDAWTGLQWRRCEQGRSWGGISCSGTSSTFNHEQALVHARQQSGWRLPNWKELSSLSNLSVSSGARIDSAAFPGAAAVVVWTSSPDSWVNQAKGVNFGDGRGARRDRATTYLSVRLVRPIP